jgi:isopenicillin N synthase-like dioxygenase
MPAAHDNSTHTAFDTLPVVDISGLSSPDLAVRRDAAASLDRAARDAGFFYVVGHGIPQATIDGLIDRAKALFAEPEVRKMDWFIGKSPNHRGYVPIGEEGYAGKGDLKEAFDLSFDLPATDPDVVAGTPMLGPNVWPDLPGFKAEVGAYYAAAFALGRRLLHGFALGLGLDETIFDGFVRKPPSQLRLIHYPFNPAPGDRMGIGAHTDFEIFTILLPTAPGLEVMNGAGEWIDATPVPGAFVVNIGDMLETWTNGTYVATSHRVRPVSQDRYSFPLFFNCDYHTLVEPLPQFVSPERPAQYDPLRAGEHLYAQTIHAFNYLRERVTRGEAALPDGAKAANSFGQQARHPGNDS